MFVRTNGRFLDPPAPAIGSTKGDSIQPTCESEVFLFVALYTIQSVASWPMLPLLIVAWKKRRTRETFERVRQTAASARQRERESGNVVVRIRTKINVYPLNEYVSEDLLFKMNRSNVSDMFIVYISFGAVYARLLVLATAARASRRQDGRGGFGVYYIYGGGGVFLFTLPFSYLIASSSYWGDVSILLVYSMPE